VVKSIRARALVAGFLAFVASLIPASAFAAGMPSASSAINDTASTRRVQLMAGGLIVLGVGLIVITVWFWKSTRPDPEPLAPLEVMGRRRWRRADPITQRHLLDDVRAHVNDDAAQAAREVVPLSTTSPPALAAEPAAERAADSPAAGPSVDPAPQPSGPADSPAESTAGEPEVDAVQGDPLVRTLENDSSPN
jgi:hypothetical protein